MWMIKKRKKILFAFIVLIIAVLLFSVVWVITVYLAGPQPYPQPNYDAVTVPSWSVTITTGSWDVLTWALTWAN